MVNPVGKFVDGDHPTDECLDDFANGRVTDGDERKILEHLDQCIECCSRLSKQRPDEFLRRVTRIARDSTVVSHLSDTSVLRRLMGADSPSTGQNGVPETIGQYEILEEIGHGGFGVVWKAYDPKLHRHVALKIPRLGALTSQEHRNLFLREAMAVAALDHSNIVVVHEAGEDGQLCFLATALCDGPSLSEWLAQEGVIESRDAALLIQKLALAIDHAHQRGVLHRDLKPGNILLQPANPSAKAQPRSISAFDPKVVDFGLARIRIEGIDASTQENAMIGTPQYMAPEQFEGGDVVSASDVYALGAILYEVLTGRPPFDCTSTVELIRQVSTQAPSKPRSFDATISRDLETICMKCLGKTPDARYRSAAELADDLSRFLARQPILARPVGAVERTWIWCCRRPLIAGLSAMVATLTLVSAVVGTGAAFVYRAQERELERHLAQKTEAERNAKQQLLENSVNQVRMSRLTRSAGRLQRGRNAAIQAAILSRELKADQGTIATLRDEAIACQAIVDLEDDTEWKVFPECMAFDATTERYASFSENRDVVIRGTKNNETVATLKLAEQPVSAAKDWRLSLRFSPDGKFLATGGTVATQGSSAASACVWNIDTGELVLKFQSYGYWNEHGYEFSPDSEHFSIAQADGTVAIFDLATAELRRTIVASGNTKHRANNVAYHATMPLIAIGRGNEVEILSTLDFQTKDQFRVDHCSHVAWRPFHRQLAVVGSNSVIVRRAEQIRTETWSSVELPKTLTVQPSGACYDPTGRVLAIRGWDGQTNLVSADSGRVLLEADRPAIRFSRSGEYLAYGSTGEKVGRWKFDLPTAFHEISTPLRSDSGCNFDFGPEGRMIVAVCPTGTYMWDAELQHPIGSAELGNTLHSIAVHGNTVLAADSGAAAFCDLKRVSPNMWKVGKPRTIMLPATDQPMNGIAMSPGGAVFASFLDRTVLTRPPHDEDSMDEFSLANLWRCAISSDASYLAFSYWHGTKVFIVDLNTRKVIHTVDGKYGRPTFSPNGEWLAIGFASRNVLCETGSWKVHNFVRESSGAQSATPAFFPHNSTLAFADSISTVSLIDIRQLESIARFIAPSRHVIDGVRISPGGTRMAISTNSELLQVWDLDEVHESLREIGLESGLPISETGSKAPPPTDLEVQFEE